MGQKFYFSNLLPIFIAISTGTAFFVILLFVTNCITNKKKKKCNLITPISLIVILTIIFYVVSVLYSLSKYCNFNVLINNNGKFKAYHNILFWQRYEFDFNDIKSIGFHQKYVYIRSSSHYTGYFISIRLKNGKELDSDVFSKVDYMNEEKSLKIAMDKIKLTGLLKDKNTTQKYVVKPANITKVVMYSAGAGFLVYLITILIAGIFHLIAKKHLKEYDNYEYFYDKDYKEYNISEDINKQNNYNDNIYKNENIKDINNKNKYGFNKQENLSHIFEQFDNDINNTNISNNIDNNIKNFFNKTKNIGFTSEISETTIINGKKTEIKIIKGEKITIYINGKQIDNIEQIDDIELKNHIKKIIAKLE